MKQLDWPAALLRIAVVLGGLLVLLVCLVLLYVILQVLLRFGNILALFVLGAIIAYVLNPLVTQIAARAGRRWVGALVVYVGTAAVLVALGALLVQPLASESSSLIRALHNPTAGSMKVVTRMADRSHSIAIQLRAQRVLAEGGKVISRNQVEQVHAGIAGLHDDLVVLGAAAPRAAPRQTTRKGDATPQPQIQVPPSYLAPLQHTVTALTSDYDGVPTGPGLTRSIADAQRITSQAKSLHSTLSTTPILLLDAQTWADRHHIDLNVTRSAGQVVKQITSQISSLLDNTAAILSQTATILLDFVLILIISVYFVLDGESMVQGVIGVVPEAYHWQATFFWKSLDSVLGSYIRAQILLALLAGTLAGVGAAVLGVPFALIIGCSTFVLQLLPVIGPMLVYIVPVVIALLFTSMPTPALLFAYLVVMEQIVTNVIGPRVNSKSVGIHPLEAMAAALLAYPVAGLLGSFLAVPFVGFIHVVAKQAYNSWRVGNRSTQSTATRPASPPGESREPAHAAPTSAASPPVERREIESKANPDSGRQQIVSG